MKILLKFIRLCVQVCIVWALSSHAVTLRGTGGQGHSSAVCRQAVAEHPSGLSLQRASVRVCLCQRERDQNNDLACIISKYSDIFITFKNQLLPFKVFKSCLEAA